MNTTPHTNREAGFAMLFAVLTSSVLLSIGLSIFNLTLKELALSSSGRESQAAFYAADSGVECALYWDVKGTDVFATSSDSRTPVPSTPQCAGQNIKITPSAQTSNSATTEFSFAPTDSTSLTNGVCSFVTVKKTDNSGATLTEIRSRGYNVGYSGDPSDTGTSNKCLGADDFKVERALLITY